MNESDEYVLQYSGYCLNCFKDFYGETGWEEQKAHEKICRHVGAARIKLSEAYVALKRIGKFEEAEKIMAIGKSL